MKINVTRNQTSATLHLVGRLDTAVSQQAMAEIESQLAAAGPVEQLICDASELTYISSSGLRILLSLRKRCAHFHLTEVGPDVYQVLEMTGFTKMMTVDGGRL